MERTPGPDRSGSRKPRPKREPTDGELHTRGMKSIDFDGRVFFREATLVAGRAERVRRQRPAPPARPRGPRYQANIQFPDEASREEARPVLEHLRQEEGGRAALVAAAAVSASGPEGQELLKELANTTGEDAATLAAIRRVAARMRDPIVREALAAAAERPDLADLLRKLGAIPPADASAAMSTMREIVDVLIATPRPSGLPGRLLRTLRIARSAWKRRDR